jgi:hypothetical protein
MNHPASRPLTGVYSEQANKLTEWNIFQVLDSLIDLENEYGHTSNIYTKRCNETGIKSKDNKINKNKIPAHESNIYTKRSAVNNR